jgi:hypothetical protein
VTRWLDYRREQIRVSFYPVDGGIDTNYRSLSPPYRGWRIIGFIDMATKQKISPADALSRLPGRGSKN